MRKQKAKLNYRRIVLRLPDLDHSKMAVLNSLPSPGSRRVYQFAINQFIAWHCSEPRLAFNRIVVVRYRMYLESRRLAANTINQQLALWIPVTVIFPLVFFHHSRSLWLVLDHWFNPAKGLYRVPPKEMR